LHFALASFALSSDKTAAPHCRRRCHHPYRHGLENGDQEVRE
ncbi:hypothetical protein CMV_020878, partial [Castanea mollissima]